jgi:MFS transporter, DHA1 family, multidrug resistance protein
MTAVGAAAPSQADRGRFGYLLTEWGVSNVGYYAAASILSLYFLTTLRLSPAAAGALILLTSMSFRLNRVFLAPLIDRLPPRIAVFGALLLGAFGYLGLAATRSPLFIAILLPVIGAGGSTNALAVKTLAAGTAGAQKSPLLRYATLSTGLNAAAAIGPVIASQIYPGYSPAWVFLIAAACYGVAAFIALGIPVGPHAGLARPTWRATTREVLSVASFRQVLVFTALGFFLYSQLFATFPVFATETLRVPQLRGLFFVLNAAMVIAGQIPLGHFLQRKDWSSCRVVFAGYLMFTIGFVLLWLAPTWPLAFVAVAFWTLGEMLVMPTLDAMTALSIKPHQRMVAFSFAGLAMSVGDGFGGASGVALAGWLGRHGAGTSLYGIIALGSLIALAAVPLSGRHRSPAAPAAER